MQDASSLLRRTEENGIKLQFGAEIRSFEELAEMSLALQGADTQCDVMTVRGKIKRCILTIHTQVATHEPGIGVPARAIPSLATLATSRVMSLRPCCCPIVFEQARSAAGVAE